VLQEEVLVAPSLVARVALGAERREDIAVDDVEVAREILKASGYECESGSAAGSSA